MWKKTAIFIIALLINILAVFTQSQPVQALDECTKQDVYQYIYYPYTVSAPGENFLYIVEDGDKPDNEKDDWHVMVKNHGGLQPDGNYANNSDQPKSTDVNTAFNDWWNVQKAKMETGHSCSVQDDKFKNYFNTLFRESAAHDWEYNGAQGPWLSGCAGKEDIGVNQQRDTRIIWADHSSHINCGGEPNKRWPDIEYRVYFGYDVGDIQKRFFGDIPGTIAACKNGSGNNIDKTYQAIKGKIQQLINSSSEKQTFISNLAASVLPVMDGTINKLKLNPNDPNSIDDSGQQNINQYGCYMDANELVSCMTHIYGDMKENRRTQVPDSLSGIHECQFTEVSEAQVHTNQLCTLNNISKAWDNIMTKDNYTQYITSGSADRTKIQSKIRDNQPACIVSSQCLDVFGNGLLQAKNHTYSPANEIFPQYGGTEFKCNEFSTQLDVNSYNFQDCGTQSYVSTGGSQNNTATASRCCVVYNPSLSETNDVLNDNSVCSDQSGAGCTSSIADTSNTAAQRLYNQSVTSAGGMVGYCRNEIDDVTTRKGTILEPYNEPQDNNQCRCKAQSFSQSAKLYCNRYVASSIISKAQCSLKTDGLWVGGEANRLENLDVDSDSTPDSNGKYYYQFQGEVIGEQAAQTIGNIVIAESCQAKDKLTQNVTISGTPQQLSADSDPNNKKLTVNDIKMQPEYIACINCVGQGGGIPTALGCIKTTSFPEFIQTTVLGWGIGLAGIFALLCIIFSAIQLQLSQGNPERIKKTQEMLTSCITGLILIIFSVFILRFIGVDILRIPGLAK